MLFSSLLCSLSSMYFGVLSLPHCLQTFSLYICCFLALELFLLNFYFLNCYFKPHSISVHVTASGIYHLLWHLIVVSSLSSLHLHVTAGFIAFFFPWTLSKLFSGWDKPCIFWDFIVPKPS
jgi:hypothetical protein